MITKFKLFENKEINSNDLSNEQLDMLEDGLSLNLYKGKKRNGQKSINYKLLSVIDLETSINKISIDNNIKTTISKINVEISNKDKISAEYKHKEDRGDLLENSIKIEINNKLIYHLDDKDFNINKLIEQIIKHYKKFIEKSWKIR